MTKYKQNYQLMFTLFGASGDLAKRSILPGIYRLFRRGIIGEKFALLATSYTDRSEEDYHEIVRESLSDQPQDDLDNFLDHVYYVPADVNKLEDFEPLKAKHDELCETYQIEGCKLYHLSVSPSLFPVLTENLSKSKMTDSSGAHRIIIEKPFGHDTESAQELNDDLMRYFDEDQIYRVDHYLGMEMVQNILGVRYFNRFINQLWNKETISNIQITLNEDLSIGGRGSYYDEYGAFLDMFQNHLLQLMAITGMELPENPKPTDFHQAKVEFFKAIPDATLEDVENYYVRGQYKADTEGKYSDYRREEDVDPNSDTETYIAGRVLVNNDRWQGVPFYYRTGKALAETLSVIAVVFKTYDGIKENENVLKFYIRPQAGASLTLNQKDFGPEFVPEAFQLETVRPDDDYQSTEYERLIFDAIEGTSTFFATWPEVQEQWRIADSIRQRWDQLPNPNFPNYQAGTLGPDEARKMIEKDGHQWVNE